MKMNAILIFTKYGKPMRKLTIEQRGLLITALLNYAEDIPIPELDAATDMLYGIILDDILRCNENYEQGKEKKSKAGKASAAKRAKALAEQQSQAEINAVQQCSTASTNKTKININDNNLKEKDGKEKAPEPGEKPQDAKGLVEQSALSEPLKKKAVDWLEYKKERRESYKPKGLKTLLSMIEKNAREYGEAAVSDLIDKSIANHYQGIIWDNLEKKRASPSKATKFTNFNQRQQNYDDIQRQLIRRSMEG